MRASREHLPIGASRRRPPSARAVRGRARRICHHRPGADTIVGTRGPERRTTLAGDVVAMNDEIAAALVELARDGTESEELRGQAAAALGAALEMVDTLEEEARSPSRRSSGSRRP